MLSAHMKKSTTILPFLLLALSCNPGREKEPVVLITLDPGHFHAALIQKTQYPQVSKDVYVYAPPGPDVEEHLKKIETYNNRPDDPTSWNEIVYLGDDYLRKMLSGKKGNVMVVSGNNAMKTEYISKALEAGINVLADKPMAINPDDYSRLVECFETAREKGVLLYDIMTERYEISTILQRELSRIPAIYGEQLKGTPEEPAITKESVHHFYKNVSGNPLIRPAWFYDVRQQGEGIVDVIVHLVDLVQWECFPGQVLSPEDVSIVSARHWCTRLDRAQFKASTGLDDYPAFLGGDVKDGVLEVMSNGEINYTLKGVHAKVVETWEYEAPPGGGDTHYSVMRGSRARLVIRQGMEQGFIPELYIEPSEAMVPDYSSMLEKEFSVLAGKYPGISLEPCGNGWHVVIPESYRVGHEAHFGQVTGNFLDYLEKGSIPDWEVSGMITKYYITTQGWKEAHERL